MTFFYKFEIKYLKSHLIQKNMYILLLILGIIFGIIALILIIALFVKKNYSIRREINIEKPISEVYDYLRHLINQEKFSKWVMTDPTMKKTLAGVDGNIGFIYAWDSTNKNAGKGEQEIKSLEINKLIDVEVRFEKPFKGLAKTPFMLESNSENQTKVIWGMYSKMNYPMNFMLLILNMEKLLGNDLELSLKNLKVILEEDLK